MSNSNFKVTGTFAIVFLLLSPILIVLSTLIGGFVVQALWEWFVVPLGVANIGILHAAGIALIFAYMSPVVDTSALAHREIENLVTFVLGKVIAALVIRPGLFLSIGWAIHDFSK